MRTLWPSVKPMNPGRRASRMQGGTSSRKSTPRWTSLARNATPLSSHIRIPWDAINLDQFNLVPKMAARMLQRIGGGWGTFRIIPVESGRGCPFGCEFCTVTGVFGDSIRFRTNESVVNELLLLKVRAPREGGQISFVFFDNDFAINIKRTKSLLRDIIAAGAQVHWVAQISANLLRNEELVDLIAVRRQVGLYRRGVHRTQLTLPSETRGSTSRVRVS